MSLDTPTRSASRLDRIASVDPQAASLARRCVRTSTDGLSRMFLRDEGRFAHTRALREGSLRLLGTSRRYDGIVLLGLRFVDPEAQRAVLAGETAHEFCGRLLSSVDRETDLGAAALLAWAAAEMDHPDLERGVRHLERLGRARPSPTTVEAAWTLSALLAADRDVESARRILLRAFRPETGLFAHAPFPDASPWIRRHVACFADLVYPIQALSRCYALRGEPADLEVASRCAREICERQGASGQWWWHYDLRTGGVVEGYPVYSVHQDGMAPMALFDLEEAGGPSFAPSIARGLAWIERPPECPESLLDEREGVIWRKVARREPRKLVRALRAATTRFHPSLRLRGLDRLFPPGEIDRECRPYHLGWILYAWGGAG